MLLTITSTQPPATDLGFLLHKNPQGAHVFNLAFGQAHVFYPEASEVRCTAALLLNINPISLVRKRGPRGADGAFDHYVNDRPYAASSFLSVALAHVFRDAMAGKSKERPELAETPLALHAHLSVVPSRGGEEFLRRLFEPLEYSVTVHGHVLDEKFPDWGESSYFTLDLHGNVLLRDLLTHLYVLIPVLDNDKHYWVGEDEVEKLLRRGESWLAAHPERETIINRYLRRQRHLTRSANEQLQAAEQLLQQETPGADETATAHDEEEATVEKPLSLHQQRLDAVLLALKASSASRVLDLGCGEGRLLQLLLKEKQFTQITGMDVSLRALEVAKERLHFERMPPMQQARITLMQGALTYRDERLSGFDAAAVVEVIEHLDPACLAAFERVLFEFARPATVVITTPNVEYNVKFPTLPTGKMRHKDHRFEWTRAEFQTWANTVAKRFGYKVEFHPVGPEDEVVGAPSQMVIMQKTGDTH